MHSPCRKRARPVARSSGEGPKRVPSVAFVISRSTFSTDGVDLSAQYIVNHNLAPVMSVSFGQCESDMGSTENAFFNNLWAQAAAQGISVYRQGEQERGKLLTRFKAEITCTGTETSLMVSSPS